VGKLKEHTTTLRVIDLVWAYEETKDFIDWCKRDGDPVLLKAPRYIGAVESVKAFRKVLVDTDLAGLSYEEAIVHLRPIKRPDNIS